MKLVFLMILFVATWLGAIGMFFLKLGAAGFSLDPRKLLRNGRFLIGAALYAASLPIYLIALKFLPLSVAYPMTSMTYLWSAMLGKKFLSEPVDSWRWGGILLIIGGVFLLAI